MEDHEFPNLFKTSTLKVISKKNTQLINVDTLYNDKYPPTSSSKSPNLRDLLAITS